MSREHEADPLRQRVLEYLRTHNVMTLATSGPDGPWAAAVFYANDDFMLYFLSSPATRHCRDLTANPRVSAAIHEDYHDWPEIKGVQLEGRVTEVATPNVGDVRRLYGQKFPLVGRLGQAPAAIVEAFKKIRWYRLEPDAVYFIDNSRGFGTRERVPQNTTKMGADRKFKKMWSVPHSHQYPISAYFHVLDAPGGIDDTTIMDGRTI